MKKLMISLVLAGSLLSSVPVFALDRCNDGSWYNPDTNGIGLNIDVSDEFVVAYFYTYVAGRKAYIVGTAENQPDEDGIYTFKNMTSAHRPPGGDVETLDQMGAGSAYLADNGDGTLEFGWSISTWFEDGEPIDTIQWCLFDGCLGQLTVQPLYLPTPCE